MAEPEEHLRVILASQEELVGSITHDLKGLLSGMEGGIYLLSSGFKKDKKERIDQGFEMMQRNLSRMRRRVASVLYYVKGRQNDWQSVDVGGLASSVDKALSEQATYLGVALKIEVDDGSFEADEFAIHSLLINLVEYSLEACELAKLKPSPSVTLQATQRDAQVIINVASDGFVIEEEAREHALGDFYSPRGVDRSHLGLFIANKIVRSHHGTLQITCAPDEGTTRFTVKLPSQKPAGQTDDGDNPMQETMAKEWEGENTKG